MDSYYGLIIASYNKQVFVFPLGRIQTIFTIYPDNFYARWGLSQS